MAVADWVQNVPRVSRKVSSGDILSAKKSLGTHGSAFHSVAISPIQYRNDHFIIRVDTERILEAGFTGLNTRAGDLVLIRAKGANATMIQWANSIYIILHCDMILEIRGVGAQVFD